MKMFEAYRKGTVLALSGSCEHLHIICNDPAYYPRNESYCVLAVNISSCKFGIKFDDTCILKAGEHPFIKHDSYVVYRHSVIWQAEKIIAKVASGEIVPHKEMETEPFKRVLNGFGAIL
jgi:hypothetical protein